jgi:PST family polysaccharide transporter
MAAGFASVKVTSVYLGPAGVGVMSQFQNITSVVTSFAAGSTNTATVRSTAEYADDAHRYGRFVGTVTRTLLVFGVIVSASIVLTAPWVSDRLLGDTSLSLPLMLFGLCYTGALAHAFLVASANGIKDFRSVTAINAGAVIGTVLLMVALCPRYGTNGALTALALSPLLSAAIALLVGRGKPWFPSQPFTAAYSPTEFRRFLSFVPMTLAFSLAPASANVWARDLLASHRGWDEVGLIQGVSRLSDMYLNVVVAVLSMYYLPRFAEIRIAGELRKELAAGLGIIVMGVGILSLLLYVSRDFIISIIFTAAFMPMRDLFEWQMIGNVFRVSSWLMGYVLVARSSPLKLAMLEIVETLFFVGVVVVAVPNSGAIGLTQAYAAHMIFATVVTTAWVLILIHRMPSRTHAAGEDDAESPVYDNDQQK